MILRFILFISFINFSVSQNIPPFYQPEQVHLAFGDNLQEIIVTWTTFDDTEESVVEFGIEDLNLNATGYRTRFEDGGELARMSFVHRVRLSNLTPKTVYKYHCGSSRGWSSLFSFKVPPVGENWSPRICFFGDMGAENPQSLPRIQEEAQRGLYDAIMHVGDFAYDMYEQNGTVGDEFMRQIEPIAAYVPYMTVVGNHEYMYNFSHYVNRFSMPGGHQSLFYSFNMGPAHFIGISTEVYYYLQFGFKQIINQYEWLEKDLKEATSPENRTVRPWIITFGHRPMYCSNNDVDDCTFREDMVRVGVPILMWWGLEELFYKSGVDLSVWAHEHSYERTWPMYNYKVYNGSTEEPYTNPGAPVHIVTGSAGCRERTDKFKPAVFWSAFRNSDYGYSRMAVKNKTHLWMEQETPFFEEVSGESEPSADLESEGLFDLRDFRHLLNPEGCQGKTRIIVIVTSYAGDVEMRSSLRQAYPDRLLHTLGIKRIFLLSLIDPNKNLEVTQEAIVNEYQRFGDILQGNFIENYRNLTYKHVMGLKWAAENCPLADYVIKMDHDIVVDFFSIVKMLKKLPKRQTILAGYVMSNMKPIRESQNKWFVTHEEFSLENYPDFLSGWLYITNPYTAQLLTRTSNTVPYFWIDDTYVTGLVAQKLNIHLVTLNKYVTTHPEHLRCCISQANFECNFWWGPNGGDNRLVRIFEKFAENCFKFGCKLRRDEESVRDNCVITS